MPPHTDDLRIRKIEPLTKPAQLLAMLPCDDEASDTVSASRKALHEILHGRDDRLAVVIGPCSIHDPVAAIDYAQRLRPLRDALGGELEIIMRVYFEKPRTTVGERRTRLDLVARWEAKVVGECGSPWISSATRRKPKDVRRMCSAARKA